MVCGSLTQENMDVGFNIGASGTGHQVITVARSSLLPDQRGATSIFSPPVRLKFRVMS